MILALGLDVASACGGFFCDGGGGTTTTTYSVPVAQSGERILFRVNPDDTVTTFVEVAYTQDEDMDFAWVIPIPAAIDAASITTASAELLNALEAATAPTFLFQYPPTGGYYGGYYDYGYYDDTAGCSGCACGTSFTAKGSSASGSSATPTVSPVTVSVVDEAVVGPFAIEVITAEDGAGFAEWLADNGYDLPPGADVALQHYLDLDMAFLGVKLAPDVPAGPIDTLEFTYPAQMPMIPLILTAIASVDDLPITAWVLADEPWIVAGGWGIARDVADETRPVGGGGSDYLERVADEIDRFDGKAMMLEYSGPVADLPGELRTRAFVDGRTWLVRWRGDISPWQMTVDPEFVPEAGMAPYDNVHTVVISGTTPMSRIGRAGLVLAPVLWLAGWWRRRRG